MLPRALLLKNCRCEFLLKISLVRFLVHIAQPDLKLSVATATNKADLAWRHFVLQIDFQVLENIAMSPEGILAL